ncbi:hypothetical protein [Salinibaculum rarum]|uniref:hypothetical protein n=1 Tax=Salinibaculum rarum TaxID=3058903 RepID=UPI00265DFD66|nr:hypothetical protein [Salinibaculum sp. KK48]
MHNTSPATTNRTSEDEDTCCTVTGGDDLYFPAFERPIQKTVDRIKALEDLQMTFEEIHDRVTEIDCDYGSANAEIIGDGELKVRASMPEISGPLDTLITDFDWESHHLEYNEEAEVYTAELVLSYPEDMTFSPVNAP